VGPGSLRLDASAATNQTRSALSREWLGVLLRPLS